VIRPVILLMQAVARDGMRDDPAFSQGEVIRTHEESLLGMRIGYQFGAMLGQFWTKVASLVAGEPELVVLNGGIGAANHLELEIGDDVCQGRGRVIQEVLVSLAARLFAAKEGEDHGSFRWIA